MKLLKLGRNVLAGKLAWDFVQNRVHAAERHQRRNQWATGLVFGAGAVLAYTFREDLIALAHGLLDRQPRETIDYSPPPPSRKKQEREARQRAAESRAREAGSHAPAAVRVQRDANPDLAVKLGDAIKH